jgi:hypothetical protein
VKFFEGITSYNNATVGSGSVLNDDELTYNAFGQLASDQQSHNGAVNTSTSPQTQYAYDDGSSNEIRPASVTYPNGRVIDYVYNGDTTSDKLNRVTSIFDASAGTDGSTVASYAYQGLNHVQTETYPTPKVKLDYTGTSSDTFTGWDNFDRVACQDWINYNATAFDVFKISHGYDQDSNRVYAKNQVLAGSSKVYTYDTLNRLQQSQDGVLDSSNASIDPGAAPSEIGYTLDTLGNQAAHAVSEANPADTASFDTANKQSTRNVLGTIRTSGFTDPFDGSISPSPWQAIGSGISYTMNSSGLTFGTGTGGFLLLPQISGPFNAILNFNVPDDASDVFGIVFGYKSASDYWVMLCSNTDLGTSGIYHCTSSGGWSLECAMGFDGTFSSNNNSVWNINGSYTFPDGFPSGRVGIFNGTDPINYPSFSIWYNSAKRNMAGRFDNYKTNVTKSTGSPAVNAIEPSTSQIALSADDRPVFLRGLRGSTTTTFSYNVGTEVFGGGDSMSVLLGSQDDTNCDTLIFQHTGSGDDFGLIDAYGTWYTPDTYFLSQTCPTVASTDTLWVRIFTNVTGGQVTVQEMVDNTGTPTDADWTSCTDFTSFDIWPPNGQIGFANGYLNDCA